ncbi:hypothetical protein CYPRO_2026 [Cyclonatronum proteinivorum]|uniref:Uncharacterized protein n=1 Tax=Cyclonatronum proteinivorum TaxID=1457365 RepID=A0A345ULC4_9BACT|nr:hypothetical protein [Cyclonatronum proteinivorum]AXJ01276.1 hypothetical protein CYPRO_2026 [Cyclonatronum proteinivorum]
MQADLSIEFFTQVNEDYEKRQYVLLGNLQKMRQAFQRNLLYPHLGRLIELRAQLQQILDGFTSLDNSGPKRIRSINLAEKHIAFESVLPEKLDLSAVKDFIRWAQPLIHEAIQEGISIYEFVDENLSVDQVGIQPAYTDEGYFFMPDFDTGGLNLYRYELSIFSNARERYRTLKTTLIKKLGQGLAAQEDPSSIKLRLIREYRDLPNPATYAFHSPIAFDFQKTLFPVARRRLIRILNEKPNRV